MNNFSFKDFQESSKPIVQKAKSLSPADFPIALNQLMATQSLSQAKAIALLLQKNIELNKLSDIKMLQIKMRDLARHFLDEFIPKILFLFTEISGFYNFFDSYYLDIRELLSSFHETCDESEKTGLMADVAEAIQDLSQFIREKQNKSNELSIDLKKYKAKQQKINDTLKNTQRMADQLYIGKQTEIKALQSSLNELNLAINENHVQIASGALHSVKNILKVSTSFITEYTPDKKPQTKPELSNPQTTTIEMNVEPIPVISGNIQAFSDNKPLASLYQEKLQITLVSYREYIEKLKKYSIEASINTALTQEWINFVKNIYLVEGCVKYLTLAWQGLANNFDALRQKLISQTAMDNNDIEYIKQQWSLTHDDLATLYEKAIYFQHSAYLEVISTIENYDRSQLDIPRVKNGRFMQKIIAENSKVKSLDE